MAGLVSGRVRVVNALAQSRRLPGGLGWRGFQTEAVHLIQR